MSDKNQALFEMLSKAYSSPAVKADAKLKQIIESNAKQLEDAEDKTAYVAVVTQLSHDISKYYLIHHAIPAEMIAIFNAIKADVPADQVNAKRYRDQALAAGLVAFPIVWGGGH